jgi:thiol-disulfide isomerase/thioredoxin
VQLSKNLLPRAIAALLIITPGSYAARRLTEKPFIWTPYSDQAFASAVASGKPALIDFTAAWCGNCHYLEAFVLHNRRVIREVHDRDVVMLRADVTNQDAAAHGNKHKVSEQWYPNPVLSLIRNSAITDAMQCGVKSEGTHHRASNNRCPADQ